jgi:hypothetical protein
MFQNKTLNPNEDRNQYDPKAPPDFVAFEAFLRRLAQAANAMGEDYHPGVPGWDNDYATQARWFTAVCEAFPENFARYQVSELYREHLQQLQESDNKAEAIKKMAFTVSGWYRADVLNYVECRQAERRKSAEDAWLAEWAEHRQPTNE